MPERWRVDLTFVAVPSLLLLPLLIPRAPAKTLNAGLFFVAFPVVAFFLLAAACSVCLARSIPGCGAGCW